MASLVPMPEAAIYQDRGIPSSKEDINSHSFYAGLEAKAQAGSMKRRSDLLFRLCVAVADTAHHPRSNTTLDDVSSTD